MVHLVQLRQAISYVMKVVMFVASIIVLYSGSNADDVCQHPSDFGYLKLSHIIILQTSCDLAFAIAGTCARRLCMIETIDGEVEADPSLDVSYYETVISGVSFMFTFVWCLLLTTNLFTDSYPCKDHAVWSMGLSIVVLQLAHYAIRLVEIIVEYMCGCGSGSLVNDDLRDARAASSSSALESIARSASLATGHDHAYAPPFATALSTSDHKQSTTEVDHDHELTDIGSEPRQLNIYNITAVVSDDAFKQLRT